MNRRTKPLIIGVCGPSASGKTLLVNNLIDSLGQIFVSVMREDNYYRDQSHLTMQERQSVNYDHPNAIEHTLMTEHLQTLTENKPAHSPHYNYHTHQREPQTITVNPSKTIIVDGILILSQPNLRALMDIAIFIDTPLDICLIRRLQRDQTERSRSIDSILQQYQNNVRPMYWEFIEPSKRHADLIVTGGGNNWKAIEMIKCRIDQEMKSTD